MGEVVHIYVFGDETFDYSKDLDYLVHEHGDPLVVSFFDQAYYALRAEIGRLPQHQQKLFARFSNCYELSAQKLDGRLHPALDQALSCAHQLAHFILKYGQEWSYPKAANTQVIGVCSGALAAAAICCSTTFSNLLPAAVKSVVLSFRTGLRSAEAGSTIVPSKSFSGDWSMLVPRMHHDEAHCMIKESAKSLNLPITSQPYISAFSDSGVTISGPPSTLYILRQSPLFAKRHSAFLNIKTPYHASHLFNDEDVAAVVSSLNDDPWANRFAAVPAISSSDGDLAWAGDFPSFVHAAVTDILIKPLRWDKISQRLESIARASRGMPLVVHQIGISADNVISAALRAGGCNAPLVVNQSCTLPSPASISPSTSPSNPNTGEQYNQHAKGGSDKSKIAIIASSGRFPDAESNETFWQLLYEGRDVHKVVPPLHWNAETHVDPKGKSKNTSATPFGCWLKHPELFDAKFFNISPREAPQIDPAQRLALLTVYEAIEEAGIVPGATPSTQKDRVGVFYGVTSNDWMETNSAQDIDAYHIPGGNRAFIPGRVNYCFNFSGPSFSIDTACSSSLASIHVACNALWRGEIDTAIAGGTNILTNPDFTAGLDRGHFLSRTGNCKTFDDEADGYCRGEGVGTVILKRLEDAIYDGDPIQAIIAGAATNHSAEAESITRPFVDAQKDIFRKVLSSAGVDPYDIGYVEMHGTGTQAGDGSEMRSVMDIFAPDNARRQRTEDQSLYIGSAKANIGHGEAASGVSSLIKVLMMMKEDTIPPHCGIKGKINHTFPTNLDERRVYIANKPIPWKPSSTKTRKVFINNFSAAGGNTALLLEDAPIKDLDEGKDCRSTHVIAVSAKSASSLQGNLAAMISSMNTIRPEDLSRLSWTTTARRMHHQHRVMVSGPDLTTIKTELQRGLDNNAGSKRPAAAPKICFTFTGQGSVLAGMGRGLFQECSSFRSDIKRFNMTAQSLKLPSFLPFLTGNGEMKSEPSTVVSQLAIVCLEMALARLWISWGITPESVVGHSIGEYAALNVAGVLSDSDTIYLAGKRAQLLHDHCPPKTHTMLAVKTKLKPGSNSITKILEGKVYEIACINSPEQFVISGSNSEIRGAQQRLTDSNIKTTLLDVPYAFHSAQVEPILAEFEQAANAVIFHHPAIPVLDPLRSSVIWEKGIDAEHLSQHCRRTVNFVGALGAARSSGILTEKTVFVELGPHPVVSDMIKAAMPSVTTLPSLKQKTDARHTIAQTISSLYVAGANVQWREYHRDFASCQKVIRLPSYTWDLKSYWMQYVHDWSLRKGDPPLIQNESTPEHPQVAQPAPKQIQTQPTMPPLQSTTIHEVIEEIYNGKGGRIVVRSDIARDDLNPLVQGHKVNGVPLCTPSVYADIALSLGEHLRRRDWASVKTRGLAVAHMSIQKALIATPRGPQLIEVVAELNEAEKCAKCIILSVDSNGGRKGQHATCTIQFPDPSEMQEVQAKAADKRSRINKLRNMLGSHKAYIYNKPMIYKMVQTLADFDPKYRALDEIILDSEGMEASAIASFSGIKNEGKFYSNPAYIDALSQSAGFVMNANDKCNLDVEVFVNHGWDSFLLFEPLSQQKKYEIHVAMLEKPGKMWKGDIYVLDRERVVAVFKGATLQGVARRLLHYILNKESATQTGANIPKDSAATTKTAFTTSQPAQRVKQGPVEPKQRVTKPLPTSKTKVPPFAVETLKTSDCSAKIVAKALQIVSEESGIGTEELVDESVLTDIGIDSLLGLMISSRFRDELAIDVDSSTLHSMFTIKGLKKYLSQSHSGPAEVDDDEQGVAVVRATVLEDHTDPEEPFFPKYEDEQHKRPEQKVVKGVVSSSKGAISITEGTFGRVSQIIAEESGIDLEDLTDDTKFTDVGIDSLLSLMICSRLCDELDLQAADDKTLFTECNTMRELRLMLALDEASEELHPATMGQREESLETMSSNTSSDESDLVTSNGDNKTPDSEMEPINIPEVKLADLPKLSPSPRKATSVVLQGRPWASVKTLFLFPDGAGSAMSYANLPKIHPDLAVIGLNCPFVRHPEEMTSPLDGLLSIYLDELKRRQPEGPYNLGGWSAGGILAYRAAQILDQTGEQIDSLVLIDSPFPKGLDKLPQRFYDHLATINLFGKSMPGQSTGPPAQLLAHFNSTIDVLHDYHASPLPKGHLRRATIIWAEECVTDGVTLPKLPPRPDDTEGMKFLTEKRTDFTAQDWEKLVPGAEVRVNRVEQAHHFSMMQHMPQAQQTSIMIRDAVGLS